MNGPNCCDQLRGTPPPIVKIPRRFCASKVAAKCSRSSKGSKRILCRPVAFAHRDCERVVQAEFGVGERRHKYRNTFLVGRLQNPALAFRMFRQDMRRWRGSACRSTSFRLDPSLQHFRHHFFHVIQVLFRLQRVVDAVVARPYSSSSVMRGCSGSERARWPPPVRAPSSAPWRRSR